MAGNVIRPVLLRMTWLQVLCAQIDWKIVLLERPGEPIGHFRQLHELFKCQNVS